MILDIHFVDEKTGFIAGATEFQEQEANARILKTMDGRKSWRAVFESARAVDNTGSWRSPARGRLRGDHELRGTEGRGSPKDEARGYVAKTEDGGETWKRRYA